MGSFTPLYRQVDPLIQVVISLMRCCVLLVAACVLAACAQTPIPTQTRLHLGTDDGATHPKGAASAAIAFGLGGDGSALPDGLFGGSGADTDAGRAPTTVRLKRSRSAGVSVMQRHALRPARLTLEPTVYAGIAQARYALPDGVLLANNRTRLTDPLRADFLSLRVEPQVNVALALGPAHAPWGSQKIGVGIAGAYVKTRITSALINARGHSRVVDPFISATTQVGGATLELRRYRDFGTTGKVEWRHKF